MILWRNIWGRLLNATILVLVQVLVMGYFLPLMGMPTVQIAPLYLVSVAQVLFFLGFNVCLSTVLDLKNRRSIEYFLILPMSKSWYLATQIVSFMIEGFLISFPLFTIGVLLLGSSFDISNANWLYFTLMYCLYLLFAALLFITISFAYPFEWFSDNIWPRRLSPLFFLSASFYPWKGVYTFSQLWALLFLANPMTYALEGLRGSLLGQANFIPVWICIVLVSLFCLLLLFLLSKALKRSLDPV